MRRLSALALPIVAAALVACSSSAAPGWTYAPVPSASAGASGAAGSPSSSGAASSAPSTAPSSAASAGPTSSATASGGGSTVLKIEAPSGAATAGFEPKTLTAAANTAFTIHFDNEDNQAPHNVELKDANGGAVQLGGDTKFFTGPGERDYQVPALTAGTYTYFCVVHPTTMTGTLTVQ